MSDLSFLSSYYVMQDKNLLTNFCLRNFLGGNFYEFIIDTTSLYAKVHQIFFNMKEKIVVKRYSTAFN